jgi:hypothetical protein
MIITILIVLAIAAVFVITHFGSVATLKATVLAEVTKIEGEVPALEASAQLRVTTAIKAIRAKL